MDIEDFSESSLHQDAVVRNLAIIGEAVKSISLEIKAKYTAIDWRKIQHSHINRVGDNVL